MGMKAELYAAGEYHERLLPFMDYGEVPERGKTILRLLMIASRSQSVELAEACGLNEPLQNTICHAPKRGSLPFVSDEEWRAIEALELFGWEFYYMANA